MTHGSHGGHDNKVNNIDLVCGMKLNTDQGYGKMHTGRHYWFCTRKCLDKFDTDPEPYLNQPEGHL